MFLPLILFGCPAPDPAEQTKDTDELAPEPTAWAEVVDGITGPPNTGRIAATVSLQLPMTPTDLRAEDLDSDGHDELLLLIDGMIHVAEVDTGTGASTISPGLVNAGSFELLGHRQVLVRVPDSDELEVATFHRAGTGWEVTRVACEGDPGATVPIGDVDGDGFPDLAALDGDIFRILHAPIHLDAMTDDVLINVNIYDGIGPVDQMVATGDRDGDGFEDLVVQWGGGVIGASGPLTRPPTSTNMSDVFEGQAAAGPQLEAVAAGLVGDLDGNGQTELSWVGADAVALVESTDDPGRLYRSPTYTHQPPRLTAALAAWGGGAGWWYTEPDPNATRPQAEADVGPLTFEVMARLGAADPVDYAWVETDVLYAVPAYGGLSGSDEDGDGSIVPDDCDDGDPSIVPGAIDIANGVDDNCDGQVDELGDDLIAAVKGAAGDWAGADFATWTGPDGDRVAWSGEVAFTVANLQDGSRLTYMDGPDEDLFAGDFDGDGQMDLAGGDFSWSVAVAYGAPDDAEMLVWDRYWVYFAYVDVVGDLDGDGADDLIVAPQTYYRDDGGHVSYETYETLAFGSTERTTLDTHAVDVTLQPVGAWDANADGAADLLVDDDGTLAVLEGPFVRDAPITPDSARSWIRCVSCTVHAIALDSDGIPDDLVALTDDDRLLVYRGPVPVGAFDLESESVGVIDLEVAYEAPPIVASAGWIYVGQHDDLDDAGAVYGFELDGLGDVTKADATWIREGWAADLSFGTDLALADIDGDGDQELIVGAPGFERETKSGAIFAFQVP